MVGRPVQCAANSRGPVEPEAHRGREAGPVDEAATQQQQQQSYDEKAKKKRPPRNRKGERTVYLLAAVASSIGFTALAAAAVYYRFVWQMQVQTSLSLACLHTKLELKVKLADFVRQGSRIWDLTCMCLR